MKTAHIAVAFDTNNEAPLGFMKFILEHLCSKGMIKGYRIWKVSDMPIDRGRDEILNLLTKLESV
jgi:hypothetical protein